jgi:ferredoxin
MRIIRDKDRCTGHARCYATAPELYGIDDEGFSVVDELDVPSGKEEQAEAGAQACPESALRIER